MEIDSFSVSSTKRNSPDDVEDDYQYKRQCMKLGQLCIQSTPVEAFFYTNKKASLRFYSIQGKFYVNLIDIQILSFLHIIPSLPRLVTWTIQDLKQQKFILSPTMQKTIVWCIDVEYIKDYLQEQWNITSERQLTFSHTTHEYNEDQADMEIVY